MVIPFIVVLILPKSAGARLYLLVMMSINLIISIVGYVFMIIATLMAAAWWIEQQENEIEDSGLKERFGQMAMGYGLVGYIAMGCFIFWLAIEFAIISVYYKFYSTGKIIVKN